MEIRKRLSSRLGIGWLDELKRDGDVAAVKAARERWAYMKPTGRGLECVIPKNRMGEEFGAAANIELKPRAVRAELLGEMLYQEIHLADDWDDEPAGVKLGFGMNFGHPEGNPGQTWSGLRNPEPGEGSVRIMLRPGGELHAYIYHHGQEPGRPLDKPLGIALRPGETALVWMTRKLPSGDVRIEVEVRDGAGLKRARVSLEFAVGITGPLTTVTLDVFAGGHPKSKKEDARWKSKRDRVVTFGSVGLSEILAR